MKHLPLLILVLVVSILISRFPVLFEIPLFVICLTSILIAVTVLERSTLKHFSILLGTVMIAFSVHIFSVIALPPLIQLMITILFWGFIASILWGITVRMQTRNTLHE